MFDLTLQRKGSLISCPSHTHIHTTATRAFTLTKPIHNLRQRTQRSAHSLSPILSERSELLFFLNFLWLIHLMLEDRTEATLETDAFATKVELISSPRSSTNTESFRLQGARSSFSYTDRDRARETNRQSSHFTPICRTSRSLSLGETLGVIMYAIPLSKVTCQTLLL